MSRTAADNQERLDYWRINAVGPNEPLKKCAYCGHLYYRPCRETEFKQCLNWTHNQEKKNDKK